MNNNTVSTSYATTLANREIPHKPYGGNANVFLFANSAVPMESTPIVNTALKELPVPSPNKCLCGIEDLSNPENLDMQDLRLAVQVLIADWEHDQLIGTFAGANKLLYHWGVGMGAIEEDATEHGIIRRVVKSAARAAIKIKAILMCATTSIASYAAEWWGLKRDRKKHTEWMQVLRDNGFLDWASAGSKGKASRQWVLNVPALLLLAEGIERKLMEDAKFNAPANAPYGIEWEALPQHHGYTLKMLFDAIFPGFGWNRDGDGTQKEPETYEESELYRDSQARKPLPKEEPLKMPEALRNGLNGLKTTLSLLGLQDWIYQDCEKLVKQWPGWTRDIVAELKTVVSN